jgi:hypothetical protein
VHLQVTQFKRNLNEIVILIAGIVYVSSEVLILFTCGLNFLLLLKAICALRWGRKPSDLFTLYWQVTVLFGVIELVYVFIHKEILCILFYSNVFMFFLMVNFSLTYCIIDHHSEKQSQGQELWCNSYAHRRLSVTNFFLHVTLGIP